MRKAKIVCTIGPASQDTAILDRLLAAGMDVARLNFSHGTHESHARTIKTLREVAGRRHAAVALLQDLQGPRIRVGALGPDGVPLAPGQPVHLTGASSTAQPGRSSAVTIPVTYPHLTKDVAAGARILIDDGLIELRAEAVTGQTVECTVVAGGTVTSHKGINLPGTKISAATLTDKDREDLRFGIAQGVDYVALSFVRSAQDILLLKHLILEFGGDVPVIAKIERPEAVECLDSLLDQADGVMVARGDLGVEMGAEAVPVLQKRIIAEANRRRRLVITATQMLESMTEHPTPTRAEASDVANAVFDGTDAVMLSAETASGRYPVEAVTVMDRIVRAAEAGKPRDIIRRSEALPGQVPIPEAMCVAAASAALATGAQAIVVFSESGTTARLLSKLRPPASIIAFTPYDRIRQRMALYWGLLPHIMGRVDQTDARVAEVERRLTEAGLAGSGQRVVILSGTIAGQRGGTNLMKLHEIA
jgi:pyruvate kinase